MFKIFQTCENFLDIEIEKRLMLPRRRSQLLFPLDDDGKNQNSNVIYTAAEWLGVIIFLPQL